MRDTATVIPIALVLALSALSGPVAPAAGASAGVAASRARPAGESRSHGTPQEGEITEIPASIVRIEEGTGVARLSLEGGLAPAVGDEVRFWGTLPDLGDRLVVVMGTWEVTGVDGDEIRVAPTTPPEETARLVSSYRAVVSSARPTRLRKETTATELDASLGDAISGNVSMPRIVHRVPPVYPELARMARRQCTVVVRATVGVEGTVTGSDVLEGCGLGLDEAAIDAVGQWRWSPATVDGEPAPFIVTVAVEFELTNRDPGA